MAISPIPLIAIVLMLTTPRGRANGLAFAAGWILTIVAALVVLGTVSGVLGANRSGHPASWVPWFKLVFGLLILAMATAQFVKLRRQVETGSVEQPGWMNKLDEFTPIKSATLAATLVVANPKNLTQLIVGALTITSLTPGSGNRALAALVFVVLAALCVVVPLLVHTIGGDRAAATLATWKEWTVRNNTLVMGILFLVLGMKSLGDGIAGL